MRTGENVSIVNDAVVDLTSGGDALVFTPSLPFVPVRFGVVVTVELDNTQALNLDLQWNPTIAGVVTVKSAAAAGTDPIGTVLYFDLTKTERDLIASAVLGVCQPGDQLILDVTQTATAGSGFCFIEGRYLSWADVDSAALKVALT